MEGQILNDGAATCRNCGAALTGRYCAECGQDTRAGASRRVRDVLLDSLDVVFAWDNKIWRSLAALVAAPGKLTKEYLDGRIVRYVSPSKMFWFLAIVHFLLLFSVVTTADVIQMDTEMDRAMERASGVDASGFVNTAELSSKLFEMLQGWMPYIMLLLTPVFAYFVRLFYRRQGRYYTDYLIFTLHFFAFYFLFGCLTSALRWVFQATMLSTFTAVSQTVWMFVMWIYLIVALRRVFGAKIVPAVFKALFIALLYTLTMLVVGMAVGVVWVLLQGGVMPT